MALPAEAVLSEVHVKDCPPACGWWSTVFKTLPTPAIDSVPHALSSLGHSEHESDSSPPSQRQVDSDGDLDLPRRPKPEGFGDQLVMRHFGATPVSEVGLQVWRGSLLLGDLAMHLSGVLKGKVCVELGSGTGLTGLMLARSGASRVLITDVGDLVLDNCHANVKSNRHFVDTDTIKVRELDWRLPPPCFLAKTRPPRARDPENDAAGPFSWSNSDIQELRAAEALFAGDCIYDDDLTDAFMQCLWPLMSTAPRPTLYLAMEKRWNFTLIDMDSRAPAFDHFMRQLGLPESSASELSEGRSQASPLPAEYSNLTTSLPADSPFFQNPLRCAASDILVLHAQRIAVQDIPQRMAYERGEDLELWAMRLVPYQGSCCPAGQPLSGDS